MTVRSGPTRAGFAAFGVAVAMLSGCGSDDTPAEAPAETTDETALADGGTTTPAPTSTSASTTTPDDTPATSSPEGLESELLGTWTASAADILSANTANLGGAGMTACDGEISMTFNDGGTLSRAGNVACSIGAVRADGTISTTADYDVDAPGSLTIRNTVTLGIATLGGREIPFPDAFGDSSARFRVEGDVLSIEFTNPAVGSVTQQYTRS